MESTQVFVKQLVSEKSSNAQIEGKYGFVVNMKATKIDIKKAAKEIYGVDVAKVTVMVTPKKKRMLKGKYEWVKRPNFKKAFLTLKEGQTLDPNKLNFKQTK